MNKKNAQVINDSDITKSEGWGQLIQEKDAEETISFKKKVWKLTGKNVFTALIIAELLYWYYPPKKSGVHEYATKLRVVRKGHLWLVKNRTEWEEDRCITPAQYDYNIKKLKDMGYVVTETGMFQGKHQCYLRLTQKFLEDYLSFQEVTNYEYNEPYTIREEEIAKDTKDNNIGTPFEYSKEQEETLRIFKRTPPHLLNIQKNPPTSFEYSDFLYTSVLSSVLNIIRIIPEGRIEEEKARRKEEEILSGKLIEKIESYDNFFQVLNTAYGKLQKTERLEAYESIQDTNHPINFLLCLFELDLTVIEYKALVTLWKTLGCSEFCHELYNLFICVMYTAYVNCLVQPTCFVDVFELILISASIINSHPDIQWPEGRE